VEGAAGLLIGMQISLFRGRPCQRRRVALSRLCTAPGTALWLLDEPFDALDAEGVAALNQLLAEHAARGGSVLLTSHVALSLASPAPIVLSLGEAAAA